MFCITYRARHSWVTTRGATLTELIGTSQPASRSARRDNDRRPVLESLEAACLTRRARIRSVLARMLAREKVLDLRHAVAGALGDGQ